MVARPHLSTRLSPQPHRHMTFFWRSDKNRFVFTSCRVFFILAYYAVSRSSSLSSTERTFSRLCSVSNRLRSGFRKVNYCAGLRLLEFFLGRGDRIGSRSLRFGFPGRRIFLLFSNETNAIKARFSDDVYDRNYGAMLGAIGML